MINVLNSKFTIEANIEKVEDYDTSLFMLCLSSLKYLASTVLD